MIEQLGLWAFHKMDPERAHGLSLMGLNAGLVKLPGALNTNRLATTVAGLSFGNPIGLAAGYDKNAQALGPLSRAGFGFIEVGAATPRPQDGNPKPRLFRLTKDKAVINRFGFNNQGAVAITQRLAAHTRTIPVGLNLGANKDSDDRAADYGKVLNIAAPHIDFATVNVSSPNTEKLRDLQGKAALTDLLGQVQTANAALEKPLPIFLKIAPDLTEAEIGDIADLAVALNLDAVITTNTTLDRINLSDDQGGEKGGLSGLPLFEKSTRVLAQLSAATDGKIPLVGVGGIASAEDAYTKIKAGASLCQLYSAMVYQGLSLIPRIVTGLDALLERDGFAHVSDAVGTDRDAWV